MALDRDAVLKQAEKLLRQGRLDGAIEEYVRLVEDQPRDWTSINALGDLYVRAGAVDRAVAQYTRIADHLLADGFLPKAAALYKKALKTKADDEHTLLQLAEVTARQGLLADARMYLRQLAKQRRERGDERGALECLVRLGSLEDADPESQAAAGRAAQALDNIESAVALYKEAALGFEKLQRTAEALEAMAEAARLDPSDHDLRGRLARQCIALGQLDRARAFLTREAAGDDPDLLMMLGRIELAGGRDREARVVLTRLLTVAPDRRSQVMALAEEMADGGYAGAAYDCAELVVDDAVLCGDWDAAIRALQSFAARGSHVPALIKLVEIAVDAGRDDVMRSAQAQLADAYLEAGLGAEARVVAEDLVAYDPSSERHVQRLRQALDVIGVEDPGEILAKYLEPAENFDEMVEAPPAGPDEAVAEPAAERPTVTEEGAEGDGEVPVVVEAVEIDLSDKLGSLTPADAGAAPAAPPRDLESVFDGFRDRASRESPAAEARDQYERAMRHLESGREDEAIADLESAARAPLQRFSAATRLGRLHLSRGELDTAIEWLERAAEAPAPAPEEGLAVLYELASALQEVGESARALAVLMEIDADAAAYRDVPQRIERLRVGPGEDA